MTMCLEGLFIRLLPAAPRVIVRLSVGLIRCLPKVLHVLFLLFALGAPALATEAPRKDCAASFQKAAMPHQAYFKLLEAALRLDLLTLTDLEGILKSTQSGVVPQPLTGSSFKGAAAGIKSGFEQVYQHKNMNPSALAALIQNLYHTVAHKEGSKEQARKETKIFEALALDKTRSFTSQQRRGKTPDGKTWLTPHTSFGSTARSATLYNLPDLQTTRQVTPPGRRPSTVVFNNAGHEIWVYEKSLLELQLINQTDPSLTRTLMKTSAGSTLSYDIHVLADGETFVIAEERVLNTNNGSTEKFYLSVFNLEDPEPLFRLDASPYLESGISWGFMRDSTGIPLALYQVDQKPSLEQYVVRLDRRSPPRQLHLIPQSLKPKFLAQFVLADGHAAILTTQRERDDALSPYKFEVWDLESESSQPRHQFQVPSKNRALAGAVEFQNIFLDHQGHAFAAFFDKVSVRRRAHDAIVVALDNPKTQVRSELPRMNEYMVALSVFQNAEQKWKLASIRQNVETEKYTLYLSDFADTTHELFADLRQKYKGISYWNEGGVERLILPSRASYASYLLKLDPIQKEVAP